MIATIVIESGLLFYSLWRYKLTTLTRLVGLCLLALAVFQLSEYNVCTDSSLGLVNWSRIGYVAITILPPLGLHILHVLAGKPNRRLVIASYLTMLGFIAYFLNYHSAFIGYQCTGNYVIFQIGLKSSMAYGIYYYGWLSTAMVYGAIWARQLAKQGSAEFRHLKTIRALILGYLVFLIPTALVYSVIPSSRRGIPSIMCGFAVLFAVILTVYILPLAAGARKNKIV